jgi:hypothetical protein
MKHLATIQTEFLKEARDWNNLTEEEQQVYLKKHPKSKKKFTHKTTNIDNSKQFDNIKVVELSKDLKKYFPEYSDDVTNKFFITRFEVNKELRNKKLSSYRDIYDMTDDIESMTNALELGTTKYADQIKKQTVMYRGVSGKFAKKLTNKQKFTDAGFSYLSLNKDMAQKYTKKNGMLLKVELSEGQKGKIGFKDQGEFILPKNSQFEVVNKNENMITVKVV